MTDLFNMWLWLGVWALVIVWMVLSSLLIKRRQKLYRSELAELNRHAQRNCAEIKELQQASEYRLRQFQIRLLRQLTLRSALNALESQLHQLLPDLSDEPRRKLMLLLKSTQEYDSIRNLKALDGLLISSYEEFVQALAKNNSGISQQELLLMVLYHLGLKTEEIVALTGKSQEALGMAKLRLKRKLGHEAFGVLQ